MSCVAKRERVRHCGVRGVGRPGSALSNAGCAGGGVRAAWRRGGGVRGRGGGGVGGKHGSSGAGQERSPGGGGVGTARRGDAVGAPHRVPLARRKCWKRRGDGWGRETQPTTGSAMNGWRIKDGCGSSAGR